jgi:hypothetical protein
VKYIFSIVSVAEKNTYLKQCYSLSLGVFGNILQEKVWYILLRIKTNLKAWCFIVNLSFCCIAKLQIFPNLPVQQKISGRLYITAVSGGNKAPIKLISKLSKIIRI